MIEIPVSVEALIELPSIANQLAVAAGIDADGHELATAVPGHVATGGLDTVPRFESEEPPTDTTGMVQLIEPGKPPRWVPKDTTAAKSVSIDQRIAGLWFDPHRRPPEEPVLITIAGVSCATPGNLTTITAQKKAGKSSFMAGIVTASISEHGDTLGVKAFNPDKKTVLHVDTEQSAMDHWKICDSMLRRAQLTESALFKSVFLTSLPRRERQAVVYHIIRQEAQRGNGLFIVIIDGHGDLVQNVNDPDETADYVAGLHALAMETRCHIYGALHLNPSSESKSRGHLGSELERKSQTNLRLEKVDEICCAWGDSNRGAPIPKNIGPCFVWDNDARMHLSLASRLKTKTDLQLEDAKMKVGEAFRLAEKADLYYAELIAALQRVPGVKSNSTAERLFRSAKGARQISQNLLKQWQITV